MRALLSWDNGFNTQASGMALSLVSKGTESTQELKLTLKTKA